jgi:lipoprotein Spr
MKKIFTLVSFLFLFAVLATGVHAKKNHSVFYKKRATVNPDSLSSDDLLSFAQTLLGTRYRAASSDPSRGFDCSGFVSYVFKNFNFTVPRSSSDFKNAGRKINIEDALPGDIILFTGTKSHHPHSIGHVAIVFSNDPGGLKFIHSTSGKEHGVTITAMDNTYKRRFVQVVRLLKQNDI